MLTMSSGNTLFRPLALKVRLGVWCMPPGIWRAGSRSWASRWPPVATRRNAVAAARPSNCDCCNVISTAGSVMPGACTWAMRTNARRPNGNENKAAALRRPLAAATISLPTRPGSSGTSVAALAPTRVRPPCVADCTCSATRMPTSLLGTTCTGSQCTWGCINRRTSRSATVRQLALLMLGCWSDRDSSAIPKWWSWLDRSSRLRNSGWPLICWLKRRPRSASLSAGRSRGSG